MDEVIDGIDITEPLEEIEETVGGGLIDSTQSVIMDAAENVSHAIDAAMPVAHAHIAEVPFYTEVRFWIGVAFILAMLTLLVPAYRFIRGALQRRINRVIDSIDEAAQLRDDAQALLAEYERKFVNVKKEADTIVKQGKKNLENLQAAETERFKVDLENKEKEAQRRIKTATEKAMSEINNSASRLSVDLAKKAIDRYLQTSDKSKLIDDAIKDLDKFIA